MQKKPTLKMGPTIDRLIKIDKQEKTLRERLAKIQGERIHVVDQLRVWGAQKGLPEADLEYFEKFRPSLEERVPVLQAIPPAIEWGGGPMSLAQMVTWGATGTGKSQFLWQRATESCHQRMFVLIKKPKSS